MERAVSGRKPRGETHASSFSEGTIQDTASSADSMEKDLDQDLSPDRPASRTAEASRPAAAAPDQQTAAMDKPAAQIADGAAAGLSARPDPTFPPIVLGESVKM